MNRTWLDKQKYRALKAHYREAGHSQEKPSEFYIRKSQLLSLVLDLTDSQIIMEVMNSAPSTWTSILTTHLYQSVVEFQTALKFHEDALIRSGYEPRRNDYNPSGFTRNTPPSQNRGNFRNQGSSNSNPKVRTYAVGWTPILGKPPFPRDDSNISKRKQTPGQAGARPCRHCGSLMHWDSECKYAHEGNKKARANVARHTDEYEELYYASDSEMEDDHLSAKEDDEQQDFINPPSL